MSLPIQSGQAVLLPGVIVKTDDAGNVMIQIFDRLVAVDKTDLSNWAMSVSPTAEAVDAAARADAFAPTALVQIVGRPDLAPVPANSLSASQQVRPVPKAPPMTTVTAATATQAATLGLHPGSLPPSSIFQPGTDFRAEWKAWQIRMGKKVA